MIGEESAREMLGRAPIHDISSSERGPADGPSGESNDCSAGWRGDIHPVWRPNVIAATLSEKAIFFKCIKLFSLEIGLDTLRLTKNLIVNTYLWM